MSSPDSTVPVRVTAKGRDGLMAEAGRLQAQDGQFHSMADALESLLAANTGAEVHALLAALTEAASSGKMPPLVFAAYTALREKLR